MTLPENFSIYNKLVNEVPIGLYKVRISPSGSHELVHCNQQFAESLGFAHPKEIIGKDARDFHQSREKFEAFYSHLIRLEEEGKNMNDYIVEILNHKGEVRKVEVHAKLLQDDEGNITGRVGAEKDVTDYLETKQQLHELTTDIGKVLHSYTSTLINSKHTMDAIVRTLMTAADARPDNKNLPDETKIIAKIYQNLKGLQGLWTKFLEKKETMEAYPGEAAANVDRLLKLLMSMRTEDIQIQQISLIRDVSVNLRQQLKIIGKSAFPKELIKDFRRKLENILRLCNLVSLARAIDAILEMETNVNNLRGYVLTRVQEKPEIQRVDLYDLMIGVVKEMGEYATLRGVDLRLNLKNIRNLYIEGYEKDLIRIMLNLVHNAIKYSWVRKGNARAYIIIEAKQTFTHALIRIENWGVAITKEELENKLIYKIGYRGIHSSDRRRPGTGLGLHDALKVVRKHKGKLQITSTPSMSNRNMDYTQPFKTEVKVSLPIKQDI